MGYSLVQYWMPDKNTAAYEWFSVAANATGEWYWMGGLFGVVLGGVALGALIAVLNWALSWRYRHIKQQYLPSVVFISAVLLAAALGDLVWGGLHIYWFRSLPRVILAIPLCLVVLAVLALAKKWRADTDEVQDSPVAAPVAAEPDVEPDVERDTEPDALVAAHQLDEQTVPPAEVIAESRAGTVSDIGAAPSQDPITDPDATAVPGDCSRRAPMVGANGLAGAAAVGIWVVATRGQRRHREALLDARAQQWLNRLSD